MKHLSIDIETYSSLELKKSGMYKYVASIDFKVLLFAWSWEGGPVSVADLTSRESIPADVLKALRDPGCLKHAYNAAFEWWCLSQSLGEMLPVEQWRCTMLHGAYCGFPLGLANIGPALGLGQDSKKLNTGKALIRYFCGPCKPTKSNGQRVRNLPHHDPERWQLFKEYCAQDVVAEMAVEDKLSSFPVPDAVQREWQTDMVINSRGVAVDTGLVDAALRIADAARAELLAETRELTGLQNPNSLPQLAGWVSTATGAAVPSLAKPEVNRLLTQESLPEDVTRVLKARQELGKTSVAKYDALVAATELDGRARGLLQFYGAGRTGRWAGRLIQTQNLPRTYLRELDLARDLAREESADALRFVYGNLFDTLSQLIRTCFVASPGRVFVDVDFSAIEARVLAWLAGEQWRLDVFEGHGKIYEASAALMFGVPIEKIVKGEPEYALRQKGKVAELALGYGGATNALKTMGALNMGIAEKELPGIVDSWRAANPCIKQYWHDVNAAAKAALNGAPFASVHGLHFRRELDHTRGVGVMTIQLPAGRKLYYADPWLSTDRWGRPAVSYMGTSQTTRQWVRIETYGGRLVENITQAVARDCLSVAIERIHTAGYDIVMHCHDEIVIDCPRDQADLPHIVALMSAPIAWAPGLPLTADGWIGDYFRKE